MIVWSGVWQNDMRIQKRLLAEIELSFKKVFEIAQAIEMAEKDTKDIVAVQSPHPVNHLQNAGATCKKNSLS